MIPSFIKEYILPKEIDFLSAMHKHSLIIKKLTNNLYKCFIEGKSNACTLILEEQKEAVTIRDENMKNLLNTFITPIDKESIYCVTTQLDWIAISIKHFMLEAQAYGVFKLDNTFAELIKLLQLQAELLSTGFKTVKREPATTAKNAQRVRDIYDRLVALYINTMAALAKLEHNQEIFAKRELLAQIKDISKRMRVTANYLEDTIMKMS